MTPGDKIILAEYRGLLTKTEQDSQSEYDKAVLALSGGALGLSFAFTKDVVGTKDLIYSSLLLAAWISWALSSTSILFSFLTSQQALRKAIRQLDKRTSEEDVEEKMDRPGGWYDCFTAGLNLSGGILFLVGLVMMMLFVSFNLKHMNESSKKETKILNEGHLVPVAPITEKQQSLAGKIVPKEPPTATRKITVTTEETTKKTTTETDTQ